MTPPPYPATPVAAGGAGVTAFRGRPMPFRRNRGPAMNRETDSTNTPRGPVAGYSRARVFGIRLDPLGYTLMES